MPWCTFRSVLIFGISNWNFQGDILTVRQSDSHAVRESDSQTIRQLDSQKVRYSDSQKAGTQTISFDNRGSMW